MPSSTSNSERSLPAGAPWPQWLLALPVAIVLLATLEATWRQVGLQPSVVDDKALWSTQRGRLEPYDLETVVCVGSSRAQVGLVPEVFEQEAGVRFIQLAVDGTSPAAALHDIAGNNGFSGLVICSMTAWCLLPELLDMQQPYVSYYHKQWHPLSHLARNLRTLCEEQLVTINPQVNLARVVPMLLRGQGLEPQFLFTHRDRWREARFSRLPDLEEYSRKRLEHSRNELKQMQTRVDRTGWYLSVSHLAQSVETIQHRGGSVVLLRHVSSGPLRELEEQYFPRHQYWDLLATATGAITLHFEDVPSLSAFTCPEGSHLDASDATRFTRELVRELRQRDLLE